MMMVVAVFILNKVGLMLNCSRAGWINAKLYMVCIYIRTWATSLFLYVDPSPLALQCNFATTLLTIIIITPLLLYIVHIKYIFVDCCMHIVYYFFPSWAVSFCCLSRNDGTVVVGGDVVLSCRYEQRWIIIIIHIYSKIDDASVPVFIAVCELTWFSSTSQLRKITSNS